MAQHDYSVANGSGAAVRSDINDVLAAIVSFNSGLTAPATTFAYQTWYDTTTSTKKRRNAANAAWIVDGTLSEAFLVARSSNTILGINDRFPRGIHATAGFTQTFTAAATLGDGWMCPYIIDAAATITFDPNASENIDGATTKVVGGPAQGFIWCDGSAFYTIGFPSSSEPCFLAYNSADDADQTGNGATVTVDFDTERFDQGSCFAADTFTAPVAGKYIFSGQVRVRDLTTAMKTIVVNLVTTAKTYIFRQDVNVETAADEWSIPFSVIADMAAGDTALVQLTISGGAGNTADIGGGASPLTFFSGARMA